MTQQPSSAAAMGLLLLVLIGWIPTAGVLASAVATALESGAVVLRAWRHFRPSAVPSIQAVKMTTLTTVLGLLPLAIGWGVGANLQAALARVVIGGLTASTLITLVLIPAVYVSAEEAKARVAQAA